LWSWKNHRRELVCGVAVGGFGALSESWLKDKSPDNCLTSVEIYDPETNSWTQGPDLPVPLCAMGVTKYYGTIYVLGMCTKLLCLNYYSTDRCISLHDVW